jgi:hypothetical protein
VLFVLLSTVQAGFWELDYAYSKAIEGPICDGTGLGWPGFFALPGQVRGVFTCTRLKLYVSVLCVVCVTVLLVLLG